MDPYRIIEVKQSVFADNNADAENLRREMKAQGTFLVNLMSSPGSGKTTTLTKLLAALPKDMKVGVMEADIDSDVDADTISRTGTRVIQLHTGGMCHLDADMTRQGVRQLGSSDLDLVILENVGNLVCPAEFDTGASLNMMILSVPEGHDKPLKYPLVFQVCDVMIVNKIDVLPYFDFDMEKVTAYARKQNPNIRIFPISAKTGEGIPALLEAVDKKLDKGTKRVVIHLPYDKTGLLDGLYREAKVESVEYGETVDVTAVCTLRVMGRLKDYIEGWAEPKEDWE